MKKLYMLMLIIFSVLFVSDVNASTAQRRVIPSEAWVANYGTNSQSQYTLYYKELTQIAYYEITASNVSPGKVAWRYDLTNYNETFFTVTIRTPNIIGSGTLTADGTACELVNLYTPDNSSYVPFSYICQNPKKAFYLNWTFGQIGTGNITFIADISADLGFYDDKYIAKMDIIQQQQAQQHQEIMNSNNSTNQSDFISFATNYLINDTTGTKSFLNIVPNFLNQLNNGSCTPLTLTIPFLSKNNELTIPCMVGFLTDQGFGNLITIYQFVLSFIVAYWLTVNWFKLFKETIDPFNYRIEVMDL